MLLVGDLPEALRLHDLGVRVLFGEVDRPETYGLARAEQAAMVVATGNDFVNTNIAFTVRELSERVPIVTTANSADSVDILQLAGSTHVLQLAEMMGQRARPADHRRGCDGARHRRIRRGAHRRGDRRRHAAGGKDARGKPAARPRGA